MIFKNTCLLVFAVVTFLFYTGLSFAQEKRLVFGIAEYPPYQFTDKEKQYSEKEIGEQKNIVGTDVDLVREILSEIGYHAVFKFVDWDSTLVFIKKGKLDGSLTFWASSNSKNLMNISNPISLGAAAIFKRKADYVNLKKNFTMQDLKGAIIGTGGANYENAEEITAALKDGTLKTKVPVASNQPELNLLRMLVKKHVDIIELDFFVGKWLLKQYKDELKDIDYLDRYLDNSSYENVFGISKKTKDSVQIIEKFNEVLEKYRKNGRLQKIHEKYGVNFEKSN